MNVMADTDEEIIVQEVDVFLSKNLANCLYLFQYPVRPASMTYDDISHLQARIKSKQQKVELELCLNTQSSNYDRGKGEQIALNVDGRNPTENSYFQSSLMDKQILTSTKAVVSTSPYAVGFLRPGELHLTPLHSIIQLRPSFSYLDRSDNRAKSDWNLGDADESLQDEEEEAKTITVKFAGPDTERAKLARERSYSYLQQQAASEPWITVNYHHLGSTQSHLESTRLLSTQVEKDVSDIIVNLKDYLRTLVPDVLSCCADSVHHSKELSSVFNIKSLPLTDQVRAFMISAKVLPFKQLLTLLPQSSDATTVLRCLQQAAMLVQGCWVVKSDILYPKDSRSPLTGISSEVLCQARDYIMWCYTQQRILIRKEIASVIKLPIEDVKHLISQMAVQCPSKGWEFMYPFDEEFIRKHPDVVQRQQMLWDAHYQQLARFLKLGQLENKDQRMVLPHLPRPRQRRRTKSQRESFSDDTEGSGTEGGSMEKMETSQFKPKRESRSHKLANELMDVCIDKSRLINTSSMINGPKSRPHPRIATFEISPTPIDFCPSPELKAELMKFIREKLYSAHCLTISEVKRLLCLKLSESPPGHILSTKVSDKLLEDSLLEAGAQKLQNKWPHNTSPEPLYAFTRFGNHLDKLRDALMDIFSKTARTRIGLFQKKVEDELGEIPSEADCRQLMEDYCIYKAGFYYLKGTILPDS